MAKSKTINPYDQASRYLAKQDPLGLLRWLVPRLSRTWTFRRWLDMRTVPFPRAAGSDLRHRGRPAPPGGA